jgi:hypothetical protein
MGTKNHRIGIPQQRIGIETALAYSDEQRDRNWQNVREFGTPQIRTEDVFTSASGLIEVGSARPRELEEIARFLGGTLHINDI